MKLGLPTLLEQAGPEEAAALCAELGLDFVELNMNLPQYQLPALARTEALTRLAERFGIFYTIHLDENLNVCDFNPAVADAWLETARGALRCAAALGAPLVNLHMNPGVHFTLPDGKVWLFDRCRDHYLGRLERFRALCRAEIGGSGVRVCVENTDGWMTFERRGVELLLDSPDFALTWDVGHSWSAGGGDEAFLLSHRDRLAHFHLHDASGAKNHLALGDGEMGPALGEKIALAGALGCTCVLEAKTASALRRSADWLRNGVDVC